MFMEWKRSRLKFINKPHLFCSISIFFFSIPALFCSATSFTTACPAGRCLLSAKAVHTYFQESEKPMNKMMTMPKEVKEEVVPDLMRSARRYLGGLGSSPPRCLWKCGNCTPCKPVHVPVPPGMPVTAEYYPEAWRCKCGNKLYMP